MSKIIAHLRKEAVNSLLGVGLEEAAEGAIGVIPYLIGVPLAGGAAVGYLASKMTSPTDTDTKALQERVMDVSVREELGIQQRKLQSVRRRLAEKRKLNQRSISHKRDMFA